MYKFRRKFSAEFWYNPVFYNDYLAGNNKDKKVNFYKIDNFQKLTELYITHITFITLKHNMLFAQSDEGAFLFNLDELDDKGNKLPGLKIIPAYINSQFVFSNRLTETGLKLAKYDYKNLRLSAVWNYSIGRDIICVKNKLYFSEKNFFARKIYCIDRNTGEKYWVRNLDEFGQVDILGNKNRIHIISPLMNHDEYILVVLSDNTLFNISCDKGEVLWSKESTNDRLKLYNGKLINVDAAYYREISPETGETLVEFFMKPEYEKHGFRFMGTNRNFTITDTHVFIVDAMGYMMGCINRSTGRIDWSVQVGEGKVTLPHAPILYDDRLYVLDDEGTLHIFEREEGVI